MVMSDLAPGTMTVTGTGFTSGSQVLFDGVPSSFNLLQGSNQIEANLPAPPLWPWLEHCVQQF
jgi:hypothetical protein